jgi:hypothetical protein
MGKRITAYRTLVSRFLGKQQLERPRRWENNIKLYPIQVSSEDVD